MSTSSVSSMVNNSSSHALINKYEAKSSRVKGVAFHPTLPWLLAAHHNGSVQIYDYRMGMVVDKYEEHKGPVRSCAFHPTQPLFATAGDDGVVKVFNYRQRKLLFNLSGHLDYIRSVAFHHEAPWIVSASDDQTVRIWNWQSRQCVAILSGHNHYVMCAAFHPSEDLLVSASLDQTVRVWDLSNIRAKNAPSLNNSGPGRKSSFAGDKNATNNSNLPSPNSSQIDLFAGSGLDTSVKFILEGHDRGVNWVQFHPNKPLILSGSDDRTVKVWRFNDIRAWELETLRGHSNNVSAVLWHPRAELIISDSEDRTLKIWDCAGATGAASASSRAKCTLSIKRDNDRFWCLAAHPTMNIFAAGHDNGLIVFKLNRERPAYTLTPDVVTNGDCLYYVRDKLIRSFALDAGNDSDEFVAPLESPLKLPATLSFSPTERALIVSSADGQGTCIQLRDKAASSTFTGTFATFVGRNRFVSLHPGTGQIILQTLNAPAASDSKVLPSPAESAVITRLLPGPLGTFLAASASTVFMIDGTSGRVISSLDIPGVKYVTWSTNYEHVALHGRRSIQLSDKHFKTVHHVHQDSIKSGAWDLSNPLGAIFYYTNSFHLKYLLPHGDSGIICTTTTPLYLVRVQGDLVHVLDRQVSVLVLGIDPTECHFKLALHRGNPAQIDQLIASSNLVGQSIIAYLREKGHSAIALQFVKDPSSRFELALECANLEIACDAAERLNVPHIWNKLGEEALLMGKIETARQAFKLAQNQAKLDFLSLLLGDEAAASNNSVNPQTFIQAGFDVLAHLATAGKLGKAPQGAQLGNFLMRKSQIPGPSNSTTTATSDWPLLFDPAIKVEYSKREDFTSGSPVAAAATANINFSSPEGDSNANAWEDLDNIDGFAGDFGDELDIPLDEDDLNLLGNSGALASEFFDLELPETFASPLDEEDKKTTGGNAITAQQLAAHIKADYGLVKMSSEMMEAVERIISSQSYFIPRTFGGPRRLSIPAEFSSFISFGEADLIPQALQATTQGRFQDALNLFRRFIQLSVMSGGVDENCTNLARDYICALLVELQRKSLPDSPTNAAASLDLAVLFSRCRLKPEHHLLSLRAALASAYKNAAYKTAAHIARRILALPTNSAPEAVVLQARKVLAVAEKANYEESVEGIKYGAYSDDQPWQVDPCDFIRLDDGGSNASECKLCHAKFGRLHDCCQVCQIGQLQ